MKFQGFKQEITGNLQYLEYMSNRRLIARFKSARATYRMVMEMAAI